MFPLDPAILQTAAAYLLLSTLVFYIGLAWTNSRRETGRVDTYLRFGEGIDSGGLLFTFMASALSLASAIYVYVEWAPIVGLFALWSPISWALGVGLLFRYHEQVYTATKTAWTLHGYLGNQYESEHLVRLSSVVTSTVFILQVAAELVVGLVVVHAFVGTSVPFTLVTLLIGSVFIVYCMLGGLPATLLTDRVQFFFITFTLLALFLFAVEKGGATGYENITVSLHTFWPSGSLWIFFFSLFALNLPLLLTDMSVWQRIGATRSLKDVRRGTGAFAVSLLIWMSVIVLFGVAFGPVFVEFPDRPIVGMISFFQSSVVYPFIIAALVAALLSTADTFLISAVQTLMVDLRWRSLFRGATSEALSISDGDHRKMLRESRLLVLLLGFTAVGVGLLVHKYFGLLIDLLFVTFGLQVALAPAILAALSGRASAGKSRAALLSVYSGSVVAIIGLLLACTGVELLGMSIAVWTPIFSLTVASLTFVISNGDRSMSRRVA